MSFYIDEETRTRFKLACTATGVSMNQALADLVNGWLESNDPFPQRTPKQNETPLNKVEEWRSEKGKSDGKKAYILLAEKAKGRTLTTDEAQFIIQALPEYDYTESELMGGDESQ